MDERLKAVQERLEEIGFLNYSNVEEEGEEDFSEEEYLKNALNFINQMSEFLNSL